MKLFARMVLLLFMACSSQDWDSGASKQNAYQQERMEDQTENVRNQFPSAAPSSETNQPF
jgi:hypothetical protein